VTILGSRLSGANNVSFDGVTSTQVNVDSDSQIRAVVPAGATSGPISVTTPAGSTTSAGTFEVLYPPQISGFSPTSGPIGVEVTITGQSFTGVTSVTFSGSDATFVVDSDSQIRATVPSAAVSGKITVTNPTGSATSAQDFTVTGPPASMTFLPTDDAFTRVEKPGNNYGELAELRVRRPSTDVVTTYLKFNVSGTAGAVVRARIRLYVVNDSKEGGSIYSVSNNYQGTSTPWTETGLVHDNAPTVSGSPLSTLGPVALNETVEFDVTAAITGDGIYSFAIQNNTTDVVKYSSKEGLVSPELIVETATVAARVQPQEGEVEVEENLAKTNSLLLPETILLKQNYPNPFNLETTIEYGLPKEGKVRLAVYNVLGQQVRTLVDGRQSAGFHKVRWNGRDQYGREVSSGLYFVRLEFADTRLLQKITLQK